VKAGSFAGVKANAINRSANVDHELRKRCKSSARKQITCPKNRRSRTLTITTKTGWKSRSEDIR
jgi:hypothetical protein